MKFQEEVFSDVYHEILPMIESHHKEISKHDLKLDPDIIKYKSLSDMGLYRVFTVRDEGDLVGYAGFFVCPMMHFKSELQGICDLIYVRPELRGNGIGKHFITFIDEELKHGGVQVSYYHVPAKANWSIILKDKGYELNDYVYSRRY